MTGRKARDNFGKAEKNLSAMQEILNESLAHIEVIKEKVAGIQADIQPNMDELEASLDKLKDNIKNVQGSAEDAKSAVNKFKK